MEGVEIYEREPCAKLYFAVMAALDMLECLPEEKREVILAMYNVRQEDIEWQKRQAPLESYWDDETRTGDWDRVTRSWDRIRASYNEFKGLAPVLNQT